ncbi:MAG: hypothetical protein IJH05_08955 [Firmicutes bacterium]|nr:hypothetical protein [Bacillota bacterium]
MIIERGRQVDNILELEENRIVGTPIFIDDSLIEFQGKGNLLIVEKDVRLSDSSIRFCGDNAIVYLSQNKKHLYKIRIDAWRNTTIYFGSENYFNGPLTAIVSERQNLFVGNDGVFSFGIWIRTADPHILYDNVSKKRINMSKSVMIGDHVWLGQNALILKGTYIGSGSVVSANCVLSGKNVESNSVFAGNPGKLIKKGICFSGESVHNYKRAQTKKSMILDTDEWIYEKDSTTLDVPALFKKITGCKESSEREEIIQKLASQWNQKNRFVIEAAKIPLYKRIKQR